MTAATIYSLLLRLYPAPFRDTYGDDAIELFCDRFRDESNKLRLWLDLLEDLAISLPRAWSDACLGLSAGSAQHLQPCVAFPLLPSTGPRGSSIVAATFLSLASFVSLFVWMNGVRNHRILLLNEFHPQPVAFKLSNARTNFSTVLLRSADTQPAAQPAAPHLEDATQAMVEAIRDHQIVMFGESHGNRQEYEWLCKLVKTPAFADRVDDIVVEFGNSLYQNSIDRYIAGEDVPFEQVQRVWRNVIGAVGPVSPVYGWFYEAVRESNLQRRGGHQIRLVLGDPYGDWDKIKSAEDLGPFVAHRDQWYAQVVKDEVLAHRHRALLIMGAGHFLRRDGPGMVEQSIRASGIEPWLVVLGTNAVGGYDDLDTRFDGWPAPVIVALSGNWVGDLPANPIVTGGIVAPNASRMSEVADAMLYLGARDSLTVVNVPFSELNGTTYGKEIARRLLIQTGGAMQLTPQPPEEPQFHRPARQVVSSGIHLTPMHPPRSINDPLPPRPQSQ